MSLHRCLPVLAFVLAAAALGNAQIALPYRQTGQYFVGSVQSAIQIEAFVDLFCGDARLEYQMWKQLIAAGKLDPAQVGLKFQVIVEPFHPWSFTASVGAHTVAQHGGSKAFYAFAEQLWDHGGEFVQDWGDQHYPLANLTETAVVAKMAAFAANVGVPAADFYHGMTNRSTAGGNHPWAVAREQWKQAVARGAASSPWYFVNGVPYFAASDSLHLGSDGWLALISRLWNVAPSSVERIEV